MKQLFLVALAAAVAAVSDEDLPPSCEKPIYCYSKLLQYVQLANIFQDSKTFVDLRIKTNENTTLNAFEQLLDQTNNDPSREQLRTFVNEWFEDTPEIENWTPPDFSSDPSFLATIRDPDLREYAKQVNGIWPTLGRKVLPIVFEKPDQFSFIPVTNGFFVPGGRFKELYYWDTYWIIDGILIGGMAESAKGVIENLIELLNKLGHIPNGSRWYYQERSQPPMLSAMIMRYYEQTKDLAFVRKHIPDMEKEINYWLDVHLVTFNKDDKVFSLLRYYAPSEGPRPESYREDYTNAERSETLEDPTDFYIEIKSAAESGWDFSTRWFINQDGSNSGNQTNIRSTYIVPVDLNAIFANYLENMAKFQALVGNSRRSTHWSFMAKQWRDTIRQVFWDDQDGIWYDWDMLHSSFRRYYYTSNMAPLWMNAVDANIVPKISPRVITWLKKSRGLDFPGGIPVSLLRSGEQWDFPNVWPPEVSIVITGLQNTKNPEGEKLAFELAQNWVNIDRKGFLEYRQMFEKYDAEIPGRYGGGGEYTVQSGFGWTNGVVIRFIYDYGQIMRAYGPEDFTRASAADRLKVVPLMKRSNRNRYNRKNAFNRSGSDNAYYRGE